MSAVAAALCALVACRAAESGRATDSPQPATALERAPAPRSVTVVPPLPCFADAGVPAGAALSLKLSASRTRGVAPLAVFFDTRGTRAEGTTRPFHDLSYCWSFGDPTARPFATTARSSNDAKGPVAGHVFETPGTHHVTLTVRDPQGRTAALGVDIVVDDPNEIFAGARTVCLSDTEDFRGCPEGASHVKGTNLGESLGPEVQPGRRLLLRRGGRFAGSLRVNVHGPGTIAAFGAETAPKPRIEGYKETFALSGEEPSLSDWRLSDLEVSGNEDTRAVIVNGKASNLLVLRLTAIGVGTAVVASDSIIDYWNKNGSKGHDVTDVLAIQGSDLRDVRGGQGHNLVGAAAHRFMLLGNTIRNSTGGEHLVRTSLLDRAVFSDNDLGEAPRPRHLLKMHAGAFSRPGIAEGKYTEQIVISENIFRGTGGHDWSVVIGPQNDKSDERIRDVLVERNLFLPGPGVQVALMLFGSDITVRDNIFNRGHGNTCIGGGTRGIEPAPTHIALLHNTCYADSSDGPVLANLDSSVRELGVFNNLVAGPGATRVSIRPDTDATGGNLAATAPGFAGAALTNGADFELVATSPAVDRAVVEHQTPWDFSGKQRPLDGNGDGIRAPDVGALERAP